jgi:biotin carboxyl carrier protein
MSEIVLESGVFETRVTGKFLRRKLYEKHDPRVIRAVIPGVVAAIEATVGKVVRPGDTLMILEAMKMLNRIKASTDGTVKVVRVATGEKVAKGQVLIEIE